MMLDNKTEQKWPLTERSWKTETVKGHFSFGGFVGKARQGVFFVFWGGEWKKGRWMGFPPGGMECWVGAHIALMALVCLCFFRRCGAGEERRGTLGAAQTRQGSDSPAPRMDGGVL